METIITLNESLDTPTFYGVNNQNMLCLRNQHPDVRVVARGYQVKVFAMYAFPADADIYDCMRLFRSFHQNII